MYWKISRRSKSFGCSTRTPQNGGCGMFGGAGISMLGLVGASRVENASRCGASKLLHHFAFFDALLARAIR